MSPSPSLTGSRFGLVAPPRAGLRRSFVRVENLESRSVPATFTVTTTADLDPTGFDSATGKIPAQGDVITLRSAVLAANTNADLADTIILPAGTYTLTRSELGQVEGFFGDLDIDAELTLVGTDAIIDGNGTDRILDISSESLVSVDGITFQNGLVVGDGESVAYGGAIRNNGELLITNSKFLGNRVLGFTDTSGFGGNAFGGAIFNANVLEISNVVFTNNKAQGGDASLAGFYGGSVRAGNAGDGAIVSTYGGSVTINGAGASFQSNQAVTGQATTRAGVTLTSAVAGGGAIYLENSDASIAFSDFIGNSAIGTDTSAVYGGSGNLAAGGAIFGEVTSVLIRNSSLSGNRAQGGSVTNGNQFVVAGTAFGGAVAFESVEFDILSTTISGNLAIGGDAASTGSDFTNSSLGGGIALQFGGSGSIVSSTIAFNEVVGGTSEDFPDEPAPGLGAASSPAKGSPSN